LPETEQADRPDFPHGKSYAKRESDKRQARKSIVSATISKINQHKSKDYQIHGNSKASN